MLKTVGTSESKSSLPTPATKPLSSGDVTLDRLHNIYTKILQGKDLSSSDQTFLDTTSKQTDWMVVRAYSYMFGAEDDSSVEKINSLSSRVLSSGISGTDLVKNIENFFEGRTAVTVREAASFATLISACSQKEPSFSKALDQFAAKSKKNPFRDQLIPLVAKYNKEAIPKPSLVGNVVAKVRISVEQHEVERELTVRYNAKGFLEIIHGPVAPMDISFDTTLSSSKVEEISTLYTSLASQTNFNNLAMVLEFAQFAHQAQIKDPTLTLDQALKQFTPDTVATFDKYQSGTCGVLAKKFSDEVEKRFGVPAQRVGTVTENDWNAVPLPGT